MIGYGGGQGEGKGDYDLVKMFSGDDPPRITIDYSRGCVVCHEEIDPANEHRAFRYTADGDWYFAHAEHVPRDNHGVLVVEAEKPRRWNLLGGLGKIIVWKGKTRRSR